MAPTRQILPLLVLAILLMAAIAGFFYAYSVSVMIGLDAVDPAVAIPAMQSINATVRNWMFAPSFFGALAVPIFAAIAAAWAGRAGPAALAAGAALVYGLGAFTVTLVVNVPMNEALAGTAVPSDRAEAARLWMDYSRPWVAANWTRCFASFAALVLLLGAAERWHRRTV